MMGRHSIDQSDTGAGRPSPLSDFSWFWRQSRLPDPQKKKKKKVVRSRLVGDLQLLPPPVSHLGWSAKIQPSERGKSILRAIQAPVVSGRSHCLPRQEAILRALTDNAYA